MNQFLALTHRQKYTLSISTTSAQVKGGAPVHLPVKLIKQFLITTAANITRTAPFTTIQASIALLIQLLSVLGVVKLSDLLFNSTLILDGEIWRVVSGFLVMGLGGLEVVKKVGTLYYCQIALEQLYSPSHDSNSEKFELGPISPAFFQLAGLSATFVALGELFVFGRGISYTVYPILEQAIRWIWALTADERTSIHIMGINLDPVYVPLALLCVDGFSSFSECGKGLVVALAVCQVLDIKRWNGKSALKFLQAKIEWWTKFIKANF